VKVFAPSYVVVPTRLKIGYVPILNLLWLDSKQESVQMYSNQQPMLIKNVIIGCYRLPFLSYRSYFINMLNKFSILFIGLVCIRPPLLGRLLGCQKLTSSRCLWFFFFFLLYWYLVKNYICCNRLLKFIVGNFNWLYSFGLRTWLFLWLNHLMNRLMWCFLF
jgi:hypothetical protein